MNAGTADPARRTMTTIPTSLRTGAVPFSHTVSPKIERDRRAIRYWLYFIAFLIFALVMVGGATRITESGLSITEWKPIHGIIPPLSAQEWQEEFDLYRQIPQYQLVNRGMSLDAFKTIFWWEWAHRVLARFVGLVFAAGLVYFWAAGRIEKGLKPRLVALFLLGGLRGAVGWWMVASGLTERTDVSQYRLAAHLTLACFIFTCTMWVARGLVTRPREAPPTAASPLVGIAIVGASLLQIYLGGLGAGLNAGLTFNTWPLMDGQLIPANLLTQVPVWRNFFENVMTVQFTHRLFAYALMALVVVHAIVAQRLSAGTRHAKGAWIVVGLVFVQAAIGITTLLLVVPTAWALIHQAGAVVVLTAAVAHARSMKGSYPVPVAA